MAEVLFLKLSSGTITQSDDQNDSIRVATLYAGVVTQGDTAFTDTHCPKCSKELHAGESLELYAYKQSMENGRPVLYTVPAHRSCFVSRVKGLFRRIG